MSKCVVDRLCMDASQLNAEVLGSKSTTYHFVKLCIFVIFGQDIAEMGVWLMSSLYCSNDDGNGHILQVRNHTDVNPLTPANTSKNSVEICWEDTRTFL